MELYEHLFFAGAALVATLGFTNRYKIARILAIPLFSVDLIIHLLVQLDVVRVIIALYGLASITHELITHKSTILARKIRILGGIIMLAIGALTLLVLHYPYFLIAGLIITIHAYLSKP